MESETLPYLAGIGVVTAIFLYVATWTKILVPGWLYKEKESEIEELKRTIALERQRGDTAVAAASATRDVLLAIQARSPNVVKTQD
jgi:hypothetical protein